MRIDGFRAANSGERMRSRANFGDSPKFYPHFSNCRSDSVSEERLAGRQAEHASRVRSLPPVERGMSFFHRDKDTAARCASFSAGDERSLDSRPVAVRFNYSGRKLNRSTRRGRPQQLDRILRRNRARGVILTRLLHQMIRRSPVAVTIQQSANDSAV